MTTLVEDNTKAGITLMKNLVSLQLYRTTCSILSFQEYIEFGKTLYTLVCYSILYILCILYFH